MFSRVEDKSQWKEFFGRALFKTFFHTQEWEDFLEGEFSWIKFERYIWRNELLLSIARCRFWGKEKLVSHPLCEYGGPLPLKEKVDLEGFIQDFKKQFGEKARVKFHPYIFRLAAEHCFSAHSRRPSGRLRGSGWFSPPSADTMLNQPSNPQKNNVLPLMQPISTFWIESFLKKTPEDLWRSFRKTLRQEIKKATAAGVTVGECGGAEDLKQFYKLYMETTKRHKNIPLPFSAFTFFAKNKGGSDPPLKGGQTPLQSFGGARIYLAKSRTKVIGGSVFLFYPPFIHYLMSASDNRLKHLNIGHAILWHVMKEYGGKKYDYFDLGGTRKGSPLEIFKRGWGAGEYPVYEIGNRKVLQKESPIRRLWGIMPLFFIKRVAKTALWTKA